MDRAGRHSRDRGNIDNGAMASFGHALTGTAGHQKRAAQIDVDFAIPIVHAHALGRVHLSEHAGCIDETGDRTMDGFDISDTAEDSGFAGDIERIRPQHRLRTRQNFGCNICYHHALTLLRQ